MKIVDRATFLTLPPGTVYAVGTKWVFGPWCIKGISLPGDDFEFISIDASCTDDNDSAALGDSYERSLTQGHRLDFEPVGEIHGCPREELVFCVMDRADVQTLIRVLQTHAL